MDMNYNYPCELYPSHVDISYPSQLIIEDVAESIEYLSNLHPISMNYNHPKNGESISRTSAPVITFFGGGMVTIPSKMGGLWYGFFSH